MGRFDGKVVIVTGSSTGIGRGIALLFGKEGAKLTITGRSAESLKKTRSQLLSAGVCESSIHEVLGDLTKEDFAASLVQSTVDTFGQLDVLVNNAGGCGPDQAGGTSFTQPIADFDYVMNLNVRSVILLSNHALPHLEKTKGAMVMISSICGLPFAMEQSPYYSASKAALDQIMRAFASKAIRVGVRVNGVNPGVVESDLLAKQGMPNEMVDKFCAAWVSDFLTLPIGRTGKPDDIAKLVAFLADKQQSEFIVGQSIVCDGGTAIMNPGLSASLADKIM